MDMIGVAGLVVGIAALLFAIYGIRDVREQVRRLIRLERNLIWAKVLREEVWRLVDRTDEVRRAQSSSNVHEFAIIVRELNPKESLDSVQEYANHEIVGLAKEYVAHGLATWREDVDKDKVLEILKEWQNEKNAAKLQEIFGKRFARLTGPIKNLLRKDFH
jgi:hypothetical protein